MRSICDRLAGEGFYALAPDLYRGETTTEPSEAQQKMMALSMDQAEQDMCGAADFLQLAAGLRGQGRRRRSGSAWAAGCRCGPRPRAPNITAAVSYYYVMPHGKPDFTRLRDPCSGHFGTADEFIRAREAEALESELRRRRGGDFHYYEGAGHAFFNDNNRLGTYDRDMAESLVGAHRELPARARAPGILRPHGGRPHRRVAAPARPR